MTERENKPENKLESDRYEEFLSALELLYVRGNRGGRLNFVRDWPQAAAHILGEELIRFDTEGIVVEGGGNNRLAFLEETAEERWLSLLETVSAVPQNSAEKGVLKLEYVEAVVKELGREIALCVYAPRIVDRVIPPASGEMSATSLRDNALEALSEEMSRETSAELKESVPSPFTAPPENRTPPGEPLETAKPTEPSVDSSGGSPLSHFIRPASSISEDIKPIETQVLAHAHMAAPSSPAPAPAPASEAETPLVFMAAKRTVPAPPKETEENGAGHDEQESKESSQSLYAPPLPPAEDESGQV